MQRNKSKNNQIGLYKTKKLLNSKGNHQQNEMTTYQMVNIFASHISDKVFKVCIELIQLNKIFKVCIELIQFNNIKKTTQILKEDIF